MPYGVAIHQLFADTLCYVQYPHDRVRRVRQIRQQTGQSERTGQNAGVEKLREPSHSSHALIRLMRLACARPLAACTVHTVGVTGTRVQSCHCANVIRQRRQAGMKSLTSTSTWYCSF